mmetsp:Transcript_9061/g.16318  ORF Transcript_9061/g.16318 Transcript_9061/m.16318 type:complete len:273 (-) Transcript_9061:45-863(-)
MGSFGKQIGRIMAGSLETNSAKILRTVRSNKIPGSLSEKLDGTLKEGHNMRIFGFGTAASLSSRERYIRFMSSMHAIYNAMEVQFDLTSTQNCNAVHSVWSTYSDVLRRSTLIQQDLLGLEVNPESYLKSAATTQYIDSIQTAGNLDRTDGGGRMLGHLYTRYFADLFGGQALTLPTRHALNLESPHPRSYYFNFPENTTRKEFIESLYASINQAGENLTDIQKQQVIDETRNAFARNVQVYSEEPIFIPGFIGAWNCLKGYLSSSPSPRSQ